MLATQHVLAALAILVTCHSCLLHAALELKDPATDQELVKIAELTARLATPAPTESANQAPCTLAGVQCALQFSGLVILCYTSCAQLLTEHNVWQAHNPVGSF